MESKSTESESQPIKTAPPRMVSMIEERPRAGPTRSDSASAALTKKRAREEEEPIIMSTAEKKRLREKKRRDEITRGFDQLMKLVLEIDPEIRAEAEDWAAQSGAPRGDVGVLVGGKEENLLTRGDLMNHTAKLLRRLHTENENRKRTIAKLTGQGSPNLSGLQQQTRSRIGMPPSRTVSLGAPARSEQQRLIREEMEAAALQQLLSQRQQQLLGQAAVPKGDDMLLGQLANRGAAAPPATANVVPPGNGKDVVRQQRYLQELLMQKQEENKALMARLRASSARMGVARGKSTTSLPPAMNMDC